MCLVILPFAVAILISACGSPRAVKTDTLPCDGVDRSLTTERKSALSTAIAKQLNVSSVDVLQSFAEFGWNIIYVDTHNSDEQFLFFSGDPLSSDSVTGWGGVAMKDEEQEIKAWTLENAPGIPPHLASCFAWHVTQHR